MSEHKRDPRFPDGAGVITENDERGRILTWDEEDGDYMLYIPQNAADQVHTPWLFPEQFKPDPDPIPWPGDLPQGVICLSMSGRPGDLEVFSSIEQMNAGRQEGDANMLRNMALQAVADPGEWIRDGADDIVLLSFQLLDQEEVNDDRERAGGDREAAP